MIGSIESRVVEMTSNFITTPFILFYDEEESFRKNKIFNGRSS